MCIEKSPTNGRHPIKYRDPQQISQPFSWLLFFVGAQAYICSVRSHTSRFQTGMALRVCLTTPVVCTDVVWGQCGLLLFSPYLVSISWDFYIPKFYVIFLYCKLIRLLLLHHLWGTEKTIELRILNTKNERRILKTKNERKYQKNDNK